MYHLNFLPKNFKKSITVFLVCMLTVIFFAACKNDKKGNDKKDSPESFGATTFKMNCVKLERSQIQVWVDSGWTNPANSATLTKKILLQFYTADASNAGSNMQLMAYPGKTYTNVYSNGLTYLNIDTTCTALTLTGTASLSNNYINFAGLDITKPDGTLKEFDFIRLRPVKNYPPYINFDIEVVTIPAVGPETTNAAGKTDPCPTICPED